MKTAVIALAAALCGCTLEAPAMSPSPPPAAAAPCNADSVQSFVGRPWDAATGEDLRRRSGARTVRPVRPGQMVTMEFDEGRLTVELDARGRIAALRCG